MSFTFFSSKASTTLHTQNVNAVLPMATAHEDGVWWLDAVNPTEQDIDVLADVFAIHRLSTEYIKRCEGREKFEVFRNYYFVCWQLFNAGQDRRRGGMETAPVYLVVFANGVLSFAFCDGVHGENVRKRFKKSTDLRSLSSDWICYALLDDIVDSFGPAIPNIQREVDGIDDSTFITRTDDWRCVLRQIFLSRRNIASIMRLLAGKACVIKAFTNHYSGIIKQAPPSTPNHEFFHCLSDTSDHVETMRSSLAELEVTLSRMHSDYLTKLSVDRICAGNRITHFLIRITVIASIFLPLNILCGLFGMNVPVPGGDSDGLSWWFGILGFILAVIIIGLVLARRVRLLGGKIV